MRLLVVGLLLLTLIAGPLAARPAMACSYVQPPPNPPPPATPEQVRTALQMDWNRVDVIVVGKVVFADIPKDYRSDAHGDIQVEQYLQTPGIPSEFIRVTAAAEKSMCVSRNDRMLVEGTRAVFFLTYEQNSVDSPHAYKLHWASFLMQDQSHWTPGNNRDWIPNGSGEERLRELHTLLGPGVPATPGTGITPTVVPIPLSDKLHLNDPIISSVLMFLIVLLITVIAVWVGRRLLRGMF